MSSTRRGTCSRGRRCRRRSAEWSSWYAVTYWMSPVSARRGRRYQSNLLSESGSVVCGPDHQHQQQQQTCRRQLAAAMSSPAAVVVTNAAADGRSATPAKNSGSGGGGWGRLVAGLCNIAGVADRPVQHRPAYSSSATLMYVLLAALTLPRDHDHTRCYRRRLPMPNNAAAPARSAILDRLHKTMRQGGRIKPCTSF